MFKHYQYDIYIDITMRVVLGDKLFNDFFYRWLIYLRPLSEFRIGGFSLREILVYEGFEVYYDYSESLYEDYVARKFNVRRGRDVKGDYIYLNMGILSPFNKYRELISMLYDYSYEKPTAFIYNDQLIGFYIPSSKPDEVEFDIADMKKVKLDSINYLYLNYYPWEIPELSSYLIKISKNYIVEKFQFDKFMNGVYIRGDPGIPRKVSFDYREGPIFIYNAKEMWDWTIIKGPTLIREDTMLLGGRVIESVIGPVCKIGGEVSNSLINGYSNMQHHGYIGHSYIGEWVNIGAGTVFSDLKNTYGEVKVEWMGKRYNTGNIKVGSYVGDHVKIAINSSIYAGKYIGVFSHVYGLAYKNIPPFTIWNGYVREFYELNYDKAIDILKRMYSRRDVSMLDIEAEVIQSIFNATKIYRDEVDVSRGSFVI